MIRLWFFTCLASAILIADTDGLTGPSHDKVVVCYIASWATYRPKDGSFNIENLDPSLCTHVVYAFAGLEASKIKALDAWQDLPDNYGKAGYSRATGLKKRYPHLKVTLAIGGWNEGSTKYSKLASDPDQRKVFIESVVLFLKMHNFDGLDLDWEYPGKRGGTPDDRKNFVTLVKELKTEFEKHNFLLTAALGASRETIDVGYDISQLSQYLDLIHVMCYDYHGSWDNYVGPNSPLYGNNSTDILSVEYTVNYMMKLGAPAHKLVLGLPLYGRTFIRDPLTDADKFTKPPVFGVTRVKPAGFSGPYTREEGFMGFNEICMELANTTAEWKTEWDEKSHTPYAFTAEKVITYDNQRSIVDKVRFAIEKNLGGLMVWSIDTDDFHGHCMFDPNAFEVFQRNLDEIRKMPHYKTVLPMLGIKEELNQPDIFKNVYSISHDRIIVNIPPLPNTNYMLAQTIGQAVILAEREVDLKSNINAKIKEIERENEVIHGEHNQPNSASKFTTPIFAICILLFRRLIFS